MKYVNKVLYFEVRKNARSLFAVVLLMLGIVCFDVLSPWPFKLLIDNVLAQVPLDAESPFYFLHTLFPSSYSLGFFAVFIYFMSTFALALTEYLKSVFSKRVIKNITAEFSKEAFKSLQTIAIGFFSKQKIGDYIYRLGYDVSALGELLEEGLLPLITSMLYLIITIGIMLYIDVKLTLLSLMALPFLVGGLFVFNRRIARATKRSEFFNSVAYSFIEDTLNHLKIIQAFSQENKKTQAFDKRIETSLRNETVAYRLDFLLSLIVGAIISVSYSIVILYGIHSVFSGELSTGLLIVFILYLDNLTNPTLSIIYAITALRTASVKISRMEDFFSTHSHLDYHKGKVQKLTGLDIRFEHVSLELRGKKKILDDVSFTIESGKRTVIFGGSGSGKTSIANLLMRFIDTPTKGRIFIGGTPIEEYDISALRDTITYVPQEITLFDDTVRNNIVFGNAHHSLEDARRAAKRAAADEFIKKLPDTYDFKVGESGNFLSGGQRQRLMLARAFMKEEAEILIFDEPFAALDVHSRRTVLENVREFSDKKTLLMISNVFEVIDTADNIIVINRGKLLFSGPSSRLPKEISLYKMIADSEHDPEE